MLKKPTFRSTWLPLLFAGLALLVLNWGLYTRLASQPALPSDALPYFASFDDGNLSRGYTSFGGNWEVRDQSLVQMSTTGYDLGILLPLSIPTDQDYTFSARLRFVGGRMGGGILFNAQSPTTRQKSHMARFNVDGDQLYIIYGYYGDNSNFVGQGSAKVKFAPDNGDWHTLSVEVTAGGYTLRVDDETAAIKIPNQYRGGTVGLITATSQVAFDDLSVQANGGIASAPTPTAAPEVDAAATETPVAVAEGRPRWSDAFDGGESPTRWTFIAGDWAFEPGALVQKLTEGFDYGAVYTEPVVLPYQLRVTLQHRGQTGKAGGGVLFQVPAGADKKFSRNGAHMVRYMDDGSSVSWGYFDQTGGFQGQGGTRVAVPGESAHDLIITNDGRTYSVALDNRVLARNVPIMASLDVPVTHIGLTASQSVVAFTRVEVTDLAAGTPAETPQPAISIRSINGKWVVDGQITTQSEQAETDFIAGTGVLAEIFSISVDILLPTESDLQNAGGGLVFHMNGRDDPSLGSMVRFASGGNELFWGAYDARRTFRGQGGLPLTLDPGVVHRLTLLVRTGSYDIQVDGETVAKAIPLERAQGWIGLISYRGPVVFSNMQLRVGEP